MASMVRWDDQPLGQVPDRELAQRLAVAVTAVTRARNRRRIPIVNRSPRAPKGIDWRAQPLGREPDMHIAARIGVSSTAVAKMRRKLGIPACEGHGWQERPVMFGGETRTKSAWDRHLGLSVGTVASRLVKGWPLDRALSPQRARALPLALTARIVELESEVAAPRSNGERAPRSKFLPGGDVAQDLRPPRGEEPTPAAQAARSKASAPQRPAADHSGGAAKLVVPAASLPGGCLCCGSTLGVISRRCGECQDCAPSRGVFAEDCPRAAVEQGAGEAEPTHRAHLATADAGVLAENLARIGAATGDRRADLIQALPRSQLAPVLAHYGLGERPTLKAMARALVEHLAARA